MKMTREESGRLGALAINSNPGKKKAAMLKSTATLIAKNPNHFRDMGRKGGIAKKTTSSRATHCRIEWHDSSNGDKGHGEWFPIIEKEELKKLINTSNDLYAPVTKHWLAKKNLHGALPKND